MEKYLVVLFWILVLAVVLSSIPTKCVLGGGSEGFHNFFGYNKVYCGSCGFRSKEASSKCINCGWCVNSDGVGESVPGNASGPLYRTDCAYWDYGNPYNYYQGGIAYPVTLVKDMYPYNRWGMNRPYNFYQKIN